MAQEIRNSEIPIPEKLLRDLSKNLQEVVPNFSGKESALGVKELHDVIGPILDTADSPDLIPSHRAAACNAICAIIESCYASDLTYVRQAVLDDLVWFRLFEIFLQRSDNAKGKSIRQVLLVLTGLLLKDQSARSGELRDRALTTFIDIICQRQDRLKVKPALQGLAHFIQKDVVSIPKLIELHSSLVDPDAVLSHTKLRSLQSLFDAFLAWVVHHDTSLSAGHLIKNFLSQVRRKSNELLGSVDSVSHLWIEPVTKTLHQWPDRIQEFKTNVFPHCFLPDTKEYLQFLSYLHFGRHIDTRGEISDLTRLDKSLSNNLEDFEEFRILLAAIQTGKELGIVKDIDYRQSNKIEVHGSTLHLPDHIFDGWLSHLEPEVRLAGLFLSIYSTAVTRPLTGGVLKSLRQNLVHLHAETDANVRREILGYTQRLIDRLRGSTATLAKAIPRSGTDRLAFPKQCFKEGTLKGFHTAQDPLVEHLSFIPWYIQFLTWELRSTASYQRRITALRALSIVLRSGLDPQVPRHYLSKSAQGQIHWAHGLCIPSSKLARVLLDLVLDPFDDIREASITLLQICLESLPDDERRRELTQIPRFIKRAETAMLRTGRADQADGVARACSLLFSSYTEEPSESPVVSSTGDFTRSEIALRLTKQLEETIEIARNNLPVAVDGRPVHGTFAAIRYIFDQEQFYTDIAQLPKEKFLVWKQIHDRICISFETLWACIQHVLCADAPEGHVPEELEEETSLDTKEILSYSWRGLKEASTLLRTMVAKAPIGTDEHALIAPEVCEKLGKLSFIQLIELRHRGAFSTVAQTFGAFCRRCVSAEHELLKGLPEKWYLETLLSIRDRAGAITRRSAGIPSLMVGIIAAEPQSSGKLFPRAMRDLIAEASSDAQSANIEESRLPQVHALNCIKEIFTSSKLSVASEGYIGEGLELAARTLNSKIWPIRNCSLMLFKALIERLLGSDEAQDWKEQDRAKTSRFSYDNYPSLVSILVDLLNPEGPVKESMAPTLDNSIMDLHGAEGVFPALQILRQAFPPEEHRGTMIEFVRHLLGSPHWHLRDMAARTLVSLQRPHEYYDTIIDLLPWDETPHNARHGALLSVKYMLRKFLHHAQDSQADVTTLGALILTLHLKSASLYAHSICPFTKSAFLDVVSLCGMSILQRGEEPELINAWGKLAGTLSIGPGHDITLSLQPGDSLLQNSLVQCFFIDHTIQRRDPQGQPSFDAHQGIGEALVLLEVENPDACCAALETLDDILQIEGTDLPLKLKSRILVDIYKLIVSASDQEVLSKAQSILANSHQLHEVLSQPSELAIQPDLLPTLEHLECQCLQSAPSNAQSGLHLLASFLDSAFHSAFNTNPPSPHGRLILDKIARYIRLLRATIIDTNPFDARFAAVSSLSKLHHILAASTSTLPTPISHLAAPLTLGLAFTLFDMLNDDDDEIRDAAAQTTFRLLAAQGYTSATVATATTTPHVPVLTSHHLIRFLARSFPARSLLAKEAARRLTGHKVLFATPFAADLAAHRQEDTALFNVEKQNLYKDDVLDAVLFARLLACLPLSAIPAGLYTGLAGWVVDGLETMRGVVGEERDGPLGWSAKAEVFALGMRVLCAAEVVLVWGGGGGGGGEEARGVRRALREFLDAGVETEVEVHGLWVEKGEAVLGRSVVDVLRRVKGAMPRV